jgi:chromodomain-helicase-DNA-binding protein 7
VQKYKKQEMLTSKRNAERQEKRMSKLASTQERAVMRQIEKQSKWSRREEQNFYRALASFGVDCIDKENGVYAWDRFKEIGQLDKKLDETLTDYYTSFYYMCRKVCNKLSDNEQPPITNEIVQVETISEERASRCIQRVELLNKVRLDVLKHEKFAEWIVDKCMPSGDLPDWYVPGKHDCELVKAVARYGIQRTEFYFVSDAEFSFKEYLEKYMSHIEELMMRDNEGVDEAMHNVDPIQYYFQNQGKIQVSFKHYLSKETSGNNTSEVESSVKCKKEEENRNNNELDNENDTSKNQLMIDESLHASPSKKSPKKTTTSDIEEYVEDNADVLKKMEKKSLEKIG